MPTPVVTTLLEDPSGLPPKPTPCALCPTVNGVRPLASYRVWIVITRREDGQDRATRFALCSGCMREAVEHEDVIPGAKVEVLR